MQHSNQYKKNKKTIEQTRYTYEPQQQSTSDEQLAPDVEYVHTIFNGGF